MVNLVKSSRGESSHSLCWSCKKPLHEGQCIWADRLIIPRGNVYTISGKDSYRLFPDKLNRENIAYSDTNLNLKYTYKVQVTMLLCSNFVLDEAFKEKKKCSAKKKTIST